MSVRRKLFQIVTALVALGFAHPSPGAETGTILFEEHFENGLGDRWVERGFPSIQRKNHFSIALEPDGNHYLRVESRDSYSAKGVYLEFSPRQCRHASWRWKVSDVVAAADIRRKEGDDAAAKLYVVFHGPARWNPFDKRVLVYVWDNRVTAGSVLPNAWMPDKERMIVLESGTAKVGTWVPESVDLARDFARAFPGEQPGRIQGLAFLADTDNTHGEVSAGFDDLVVRCGSKAT